MHDMVIIGGGVVGTLLALSLRASIGSRFDIVIIDPLSQKSSSVKAALANNETSPEFWHEQSHRVSAVNKSLYHNLQLILGDRLSHFAQPMRSMQVWSAEFGGHFQIDPEDYGFDAMASVISNECLVALLQTQAHEQKLAVIKDSFLSLTPELEGYKLVTAQGQILRSRYVVGADGAQSIVARQLMLPRRLIGQPVRAISAQLQLPTEFACDQARQWFFDDGSILGMLPVKGATQVRPLQSLVWSFPSRAKVLPSSTAALTAALNIQLGRVNGFENYSDLKVISTPKTWPLHRFRVETKNLAQEYPGLFLIGDAAHVIHPLAGQGLNLGLGDVFELAKTLTKVHLNERSLHAASEAYSASRYRQVLLMQSICESFRAYFEHNSQVLTYLGARAFRHFNQNTVLKRAVTQTMSL